MFGKHDLAAKVVLLMLIEGLSIALNITYHPQSQPWLTIVIVLVFAVIAGVWLHVSPYRRVA